jgi:hypothetical protein
MPATCAGGGPCSDHTQQQGRRERKCQDDRAAARASERGLRIRDGVVDTTLRVGG